MTRFITAHTKEELDTAVILFREYGDWLNADLCFQGFEEELKTLDEMYNEQDGGIILCKLDKEWAGCVALRRMDATRAELKRMWLRPAYRGKGLGEKLLQEILLMANSLGYHSIRLDTLSRLEAAIGLYKKYGFYEIKAYYPNPLKDVVYMEMKIEQRPDV